MIPTIASAADTPLGTLCPPLCSKLREAQCHQGMSRREGQVREALTPTFPETSKKKLQEAHSSSGSVRKQSACAREALGSSWGGVSSSSQEHEGGNW